jgi:hypothetical protein
MDQKFKLHTPKFCQCPAQTRRAVTQSASGAVTKNTKLEAPFQAVTRERVKNVQVMFGAWTCFSGVTGYASHSVTCGVGAVDQAAFPHAPLPGLPSQSGQFCNIYRSAGFEPRTKVQQVQVSNHLNTSD